MKPTVLLVDDDAANRNSIKRVLRHTEIDFVEAENGQQALDILSNIVADLVLLDIDMPVMNGYTFLEIFKGVDTNRAIPVCVMTAWTNNTYRRKAVTLGADDFVTKPIDNTELQTRVKSLLRIRDYHKRLLDFNAELDAKVELRTYELLMSNRDLHYSRTETLKAYHEVVMRLAMAAEFKDKVTASHIQRMSHYSALLARQCGWSEEDADLLLEAAKMHDIGKIGIADAILSKPGKLTEAEFIDMQRHCDIGASILSGSNSNLLQVAEQVALHHHEWFDGSGYPQGLLGMAIPEVGRIVAIADVFDALMTRRPYKEPWPLEKVYTVMMEGSGSHFDPELLNLFLKDEAALMEIYHRYPDEQILEPVDRPASQVG